MTTVTTPSLDNQGEGWFRVAVVVVARVYLMLMLGGLLWSTVPTVIGWHSTIVSSGSMAPRLPVGSVLLSAPINPDKIRIGNVVLARDPANRSRLLSHRFVGSDSHGNLITRGDANGHDDSSTTPRADVIGIGRLLVPYSGLPSLWLRTGKLSLLFSWVLVSAGAFGIVSWDRSTRPKPPETDPKTGPKTGSRTANKHSAAPKDATLFKGTALTSVLVVAAATSVALFPPGSSGMSLAAFSAKTISPSNSWALDPQAQFGPGNYGAAVLADSPVIFWKLDENPATGTANDSSKGHTVGAYSATGTTGGQVGAHPRQVSSAVLFDGVAGCVIGKKAANHTALSVEAWFKTGTTLGGRIAGWGTSNTTAPSTSSDRQIYMTNSGTLIWGVDPGTQQTVTTALAYNDSQWHHVVGTVGPGTAQSLYVDGALQASRSNTATGNYSGYFRVGCGELTGWPAAPTSNYFAGTLADIAVYTTPLTATQVAAHYYAG